MYGVSSFPTLCTNAQSLYCSKLVPHHRYLHTLCVHSSSNLFAIASSQFLPFGKTTISILISDLSLFPIDLWLISFDTINHFAVCRFFTAVCASVCVLTRRDTHNVHRIAVPRNKHYRQNTVFLLTIFKFYYQHSNKRVSVSVCVCLFRILSKKIFSAVGLISNESFLRSLTYIPLNDVHFVISAKVFKNIFAVIFHEMVHSKQIIKTVFGILVFHWLSFVTLSFSFASFRSDKESILSYFLLKFCAQSLCVCFTISLTCLFHLRNRHINFRGRRRKVKVLCLARLLVLWYVKQCMLRFICKGSHHKVMRK